MGACSLPGVSTVCDVVGGAVGGAADSVFDAAARKIAEGFAAGTRMVVTFWPGATVPGCATATGPCAAGRAAPPGARPRGAIR
mgnify:CR=1 FL=1